MDAMGLVFAQVDLLSTKSVDELAEQVDGKIDVLVINAGMHDNATVLEGARQIPLHCCIAQHGAVVLPMQAA